MELATSSPEPAGSPLSTGSLFSAGGLDSAGAGELLPLGAGRRLVSGCVSLGGEGQAVLAPLGDALGRYDGERQREALAAVRRRLEELAARLEEDSRRRGRVYQALGLSGGAFLVILLL